MIWFAIKVAGIVAAVFVACAIGQPATQWVIDHSARPIQRFAAWMGLDNNNPN